MALRAKFKFEADVFFMILLRKIMKNTSASKEYSAAASGRSLFAQSPIIIWRRRRQKPFYTTPQNSILRMKMAICL